MCSWGPWGQGPGGPRGPGRGRGGWGWRELPQLPQVAPPKPNAFRVAITVLNNAGINSVVSPYFGRTPYIAFVDIILRHIDRVEIVPNPAASMAGGQGGGAGFIVVQLILNSGARAVVTAAPAPNIAMKLQVMGIAIYRVQPGITVRDALRQLGLIIT